MTRLPKKKQIIWDGTIGFGGKRKNKGKIIRMTVTEKWWDRRNEECHRINNFE